MGNLLEMIQHEQWNEALQLFLQMMGKESLTEEECILGATVMEHYEEWENMYDLITLGLKQNPRSYELYILLGNYYARKNTDQAYLSYENALYYAQKSQAKDDVDYIKELIEGFLAVNKVTVRNVSFILLSYNTLDYSKMCIESIRNTCLKGSYEIVVVDNASEDGSVKWLREQKDIKLIENRENVGFPKGCNQGIKKATAENDILLINNDTVLMNNSLYLLRMGLYENGNIGSAGAVTNYAGNNQIVYSEGRNLEDYYAYAFKNNIPLRNSYEIKSMLIMFAMIIKRSVFDQVGELDERFSPGNFEDNDYGLRILLSGHLNVLCRNSFIFHFGSKSFGKEGSKYRDLLAVNARKFNEKWGFSMLRFSCERDNIADLIHSRPDELISELMTGCGAGNLANQ